MAHLLVTEKPSVARDIAKILGVRGRRDGCFVSDRLWITWCFGHMAELVEPAAYDEDWKSWSRRTLPMIPEAFRVRAIPSNQEQVDIITALMHDDEVECVINGCDAGREGELIFRYVYEVAGCDKPTKRLWLSSLTDTAVKQAIRSLRAGEEYDPLGDAARCRSEADWLVGLNATRALTLQCRAAGADLLLSVGRVQTPTLSMIVTREEEIEAFVPDDFWEVFAKFDAGPQDEGISPTYEGKWTGAEEDRLHSAEEARAIKAALNGQTGTVTKVTHRDVRDRPPYLFDLTALQRAANQRYGLSAQATLDAAQALYEKHKVLTYPRTDSNYLTTDMKATLPDAVQAVNQGPYAPFCAHLLENLPLKTSKRVVNDDEVGDHHAIIPTDRQANLSSMSNDEKRVYDLVVRRFLAVFYPDAIFATTQIHTEVASHKFVTKGKVRREAGWQVVDPPSRYRQGKGGKGKKKEEEILPNVARDQHVPVHSSRVHHSKTKAPRRYSESALLGAMERAGNELEDAMMRRAMKESGLGTPATRASIIETLLRREYIQRSGKSLVPTLMGRALVNAIPSDELRSAQLTGEWEAKLTRVAEGKLSREEFMREARTLTAALTTALLDNTPSLPDELLADEDSLGDCPLCGTAVTDRGKVYSCRRGRDCSFVIFKKVAQKPIGVTIVRKLLADGQTGEINGFTSRKGKKFAAALRLNDEGKVEFAFDSGGRGSSPPRQRAPRQAPAPPSAPPTLTCPRCREGKIIQGRTGWGCSRWREGCRMVVRFDQQGRTLTEADGLALFSAGRTDVLDGFTDEHGGTFRARVVLVPWEDPPVEIERTVVT